MIAVVLRRLLPALLLLSAAVPAWAALLVTLPNTPFYRSYDVDPVTVTPSPAGSLEGGSLGGSFVVDFSRDDFNQVAVTTTGGSLIAGDMPYVFGGFDFNGGLDPTFGPRHDAVVSGIIDPGERFLYLAVYDVFFDPVTNLQSVLFLASELSCAATNGCFLDTNGDGTLIAFDKLTFDLLAPDVRYAVLTATAIDLPEPASMALLGAGLLGLGVARRRAGR